MFRNITNLTRQKVSQYTSSSFNKFSKFGFSSTRSTASKTLGYGLLGVGTAGLSYLTYQNMKAGNRYNQQLLLQNLTAPKDISTQRVKDTLVYFAGGLTLTGGVMSLMLRSPRIVMASTNLWLGLLTLPPSIFFMYKMRSTDVKSNNLAKHLYMLGFNSCIGFSLLPLGAFVEMAILREAFLLTSGCFAGLGYTAYMSRDDSFLGMSGILGAGLGGMMAISFANIFLNSPILFNIWLYGGMALFLGLTLYDLKEIQLRAKKAYTFDPMSESVGIYLDFINIMIRMTYILQGRKK